MDVTEQARRSDALHYDNISRRELCNMVARLESENANLRELMYGRAHVHAIQHMTEDELRITAANALDECAKMRELLQMALTSHDKMCAQRGNCFGCQFFEFDGPCPIIKLQKASRGLGVEVDDGN